jgi:methylthioribose-1-phosphate isomerase
MPGLNAIGIREEVLICPAGTQARNDGFDVTPAKLVTALITEHGAVAANAQALADLAKHLGKDSGTSNIER